MRKSDLSSIELNANVWLEAKLLDLATNQNGS